METGCDEDIDIFTEVSKTGLSQLCPFKMKQNTHCDISLFCALALNKEIFEKVTDSKYDNPITFL